MQLYIVLIGALILCQSKAEGSPNVVNQENETKIPVSIQTEPNTEIVKNNTVSENVNNTVEVDVKEQAVALNGGGIQNITVNNLIDENSTASEGKPQNVFKGGIIGTSTVQTVDAKEVVLIENDVILTGNGVADPPFVADDVIDENSTQSNVSNESTIATEIAQFGNDIQARATDVTTEKSNKTVSTEENENTKVVKVSNFDFETEIDDNNNGKTKLVSVNVAMKNNQTRTIIFQFPINIYVDHVNKKTGFITRLKKNETSTSDVYIADTIRNLIKKSKENLEEEGKTTKNSSLVQDPGQLKVDLLRNK